MPVGSKRPRASEISETPAPLVPLEDMPDPKKQLELREVIIVSSRDSSSTIRTTTNILLMHSQQLLHAARDVDAPLPLDCLPSTMGILEKLFWAEPWEDPVKGLTNEIDVLALRMPAWIRRRDWKEHQQLQELYERAELPDGVHQAALSRLLVTGRVARLTCLRAGDICRVIDHYTHCRPRNICRAVKYLSTANLPLISPDIAMDVLARLGKLAAEHASSAGKLRQLELVDALQHMRTHKIPLGEAVMYFAAKLDPEAGVECANLSICIEDMLFHHIREVMRYAGRFDSDGNRIVADEPWTGYLRPKP